MLLPAEVPYPDRHALIAIQGLFELGNPMAAAAEFLNINPLYTFHCDVAYARTRILLRLQAYTALTTALEQFQRCYPDAVGLRVIEAMMLQRTERVEEAIELLSPWLELAPDRADVPYNLACFLANLGALHEASRMLERALSVDRSGHFTKGAQSDPDLEPLRKKGDPI